MDNKNYIRLDGINNNTYNLLFSDNLNLSKEEEGSYQNLIANRTINYFTKIYNKNIFIKMINYILKDEMIKSSKISFNKKTKQYEYKADTYIISFDLLSNSFLDKDIKDELTSNKREKQCHIKSMQISPSIKDSKIVTGYVLLKNKKILHSVIEYNYKDKDFILDWTKNIKLSKDQYIKLTDFKEIASFSGSKVLEDINIIKNTLNIGIKPYLTFRDEIIKDLDKNKELLKISKI